MPDPVFGEKACAFVILQRRARASTFDELIAFLRRQQIASFKLPERLEVVSEFPLSPVGKILKRQLREAIAEKMDAKAPPESHTLRQEQETHEDCASSAAARPACISLR